jgi:hypothetical protein
MKEHRQVKNQNYINLFILVTDRINLANDDVICTMHTCEVKPAMLRQYCQGTQREMKYIAT